MFYASLNQRRNLRSDEARIERPCDGHISSALNDRASICKERKRVWRTFEAEKKIVEPDLAMCGETITHRGEVDRPMMLVNLYRVTAAESNVRAALSGQMRELALVTHRATSSRVCSRHLGALARPEIEGEQSTAHELWLTGEQLERLGDLNGSGEI